MKALILGTAGVQVNIPISNFPLQYQSVVFMDDQVKTDVAGVAYSHCLVLSKLDSRPTMITGIGNDKFAQMIKQSLLDLEAELIIEEKNSESLCSVILYDGEGKRMILREGRNEHLYEMNPNVYQNLGHDYDVAMFSLAGFSRKLLPIVKQLGIPIICDMQRVDNLRNDYGKEFMEYSDIIFFSDDHYQGDLDLLVQQLYIKYKFKIIVVGRGAKGVKLVEEGKIIDVPAFETQVVNTVGAGDSLFACFTHCYFEGDSAKKAIIKAQIYAAEKIKHHTASTGLMSLDELNDKFENFLMEGKYE
jgi:ribokinase